MMDEKKQELSNKLFDAVKKGDDNVFTQLLNAGADPNMKDKDGRTPLHEAVGQGNDYMVTLLLKNGADVDATSSNGQTPLHEAYTKGAPNEVVGKLKDFKASVTIKDKNGDTPFELKQKFETLGTLFSANSKLLDNLPESDRPQAAAALNELENTVATKLKVNPEMRGVLSEAQATRNSTKADQDKPPSDPMTAGIVSGIKDMTSAVQNDSLAPHQASTGIAAVNNQFDDANKEKLSGDSTIKQGGAKSGTSASQTSTSEASKSKAPPSKTQQFFKDIGDSLNSKLKSNLAQGKRDLLAIPILGPILGAIFKAIRNSIDAKKREQAAEARAAKEATTSQEVAGQPPAQDQANKAKATVSTADATAADAKAPQQTMTNKHGNVTVTPGKPDKLSAKSPEALMQAVKDKDYKSFTITSGSPEQSLKAMQHGLEIGVPHVKLSEAQEKRINDLPTDTGNKKLDAKNQKLKDDYQEVKGKYEAKLQTTNQSTASLGGAGSTVPAATPTTATPAAAIAQPTKPLPLEPATLTASTTTPTNAAAQTGAAPIAAPKRDLPTPPQQWTKESWAELKQAKGKDDKDTKGSDNAKGAVLSKAMSSGNSVSKDSIKALKDSMGPEAFTRVAIVALTTPTPKPTPQANNQNSKEEKPKEDKATRAAQKQSNVNALMQNLTPAQLIVVVDAVSKGDNKKSEKSLERMDNNKEEWKKDHPKDQGAKPSASAATAKKYGAPPLFVKALAIVDKLVDKAQEKRAATSDKSNKSDKENAGPANKQSNDSSKTEDKKANASSKSSKSAGGFAAQAGAPPLIQKAIELIEKKVTESKEKQQQEKQQKQNSSSSTPSQQPKK